jgi:hypothetical protein
MFFHGSFLLFVTDVAIHSLIGLLKKVDKIESALKNRTISSREDVIINLRKEYFEIADLVSKIGSTCGISWILEMMFHFLMVVLTIYKKSQEPLSSAAQVTEFSYLTIAIHAIPIWAVNVFAQAATDQVSGSFYQSL